MEGRNVLRLYTVRFVRRMNVKWSTYQLKKRELRTIRKADRHTTAVLRTLKHMFLERFLELWTDNFIRKIENKIKHIRLIYSNLYGNYELSTERTAFQQSNHFLQCINGYHNSLEMNTIKQRRFFLSQSRQSTWAACFL